MTKCNRDQVKRSQKKRQREKDPVVRQWIQMILLREDGNTQPKIAELMRGGIAACVVVDNAVTTTQKALNRLSLSPKTGQVVKRESRP